MVMPLNIALSRFLLPHHVTVLFLRPRSMGPSFDQVRPKGVTVVLAGFTSAKLSPRLCEEEHRKN